MDNSKSSKKLRAKELKGKIRYDGYEPNAHAEYFVVEQNGVLNYHSGEGIFRTLEPFEKK